MTQTAVSNGRPRKNLSDEIDRLEGTLGRFDCMIGGLAEGIEGTIHDAVRAAVAVAVQAAVEGPIMEECPASALRRHSHATLFLDRAAASKLG